MKAASIKLRLALTLIFGIVLCYSLIQSFYFRFTLTLPFIIISAAGLLICLRWKNFVLVWTSLRKHMWGKIITSAAAAGIAAAIIVCAVISGLMLSAICKALPEGGTTVVVLGAQVVGDQPRLMLQRRLEAALEFLNANPEASAVLSGGLGSSAYISEAEAMRRFLVANGICESRLFLEEYSTSTYENITFSKIIIEANDLPQNVAIATDGFHMFRAHYFSTNAGLAPSSIPSRTPLGALPYFWLREIAAILVGVAIY